MARSLSQQLELLRELTDVTEGRVEADLTDRGREVVRRAGERLRFSHRTVVALAGATGSGKSSLFNALTGQDLAEVGARRPTTSHTLAVSFGPTDAALLDWLGIQRRAEVPATAKGQEDLVLLDLPDHDSTQTDHHVEVDRMVRVVDQFCFVVDPQKYADAALHERYLRPLAAHRDVITVVLNHADRLGPDELRACLADLRRLLDDDGLPGVPVVATSALTGQGVDDLRKRLVTLASRTTAAAARLGADVDAVASQFLAVTGEAGPTAPGKPVVARLQRNLEAAAGVPLVTDAVRRAMLHRGALATGWPLVSWLRRLRPDPLKRLRLGGARSGETPPAVTERSSLPVRGSVTEAQLRTGLRALATELGHGMAPGWQRSVHDAVHSNADALPDTLDRAVVTADLGTSGTPVWWQLLRGLQWLLIAAVAVGAVWLGANVVLAYFMLPPLPGFPVTLNEGLDVPVPTILVLGGLLAGIVLGVVARVFVGLGARSAARRARAVLVRRVRAVAERDVLGPATAELGRHARARDLLRGLR